MRRWSRLPTAEWVSLEANPSAPSKSSETVVLPGSLIATSWVRTTQLSYSQIPDSQKLCEMINVGLSSEFWSDRSQGCWLGGATSALMVNKGLLLGPWNPLSLETLIPWSQGQVLKEEPLIYLPLAGPLTLPQESTPHLLMRSSCLATFPHCPNYPNLSQPSSSFKPIVLNLGYILEPSSSNLLIK